MISTSRQPDDNHLQHDQTTDQYDQTTDQHDQTTKGSQALGLAVRLRRFEGV